jgi:hypothetical protein
LFSLYIFLLTSVHMFVSFLYVLMLFANILLSPIVFACVVGCLCFGFALLPFCLTTCLVLIFPFCHIFFIHSFFSTSFLHFLSEFYFQSLSFHVFTARSVQVVGFFCITEYPYKCSAHCLLSCWRIPGPTE